MANTSIEARVFATTRWSLVLIGAKFDGGEAKAREALAELCRTYWRPIFSFVCRRGYSSEDAQDLTQDFFVMILESNWLQHADESRGRFRSFLLKSLQNFLNHAAERKQARKRGGDLQFVSWDEWMAEAPSEMTLPPQALESLPPKQLFDLRWATTVVEQALRRLPMAMLELSKNWFFKDGTPMKSIYEVVPGLDIRDLIKAEPLISVIRECERRKKETVLQMIGEEKCVQFGLTKSRKKK